MATLTEVLSLVHGALEEARPNTHQLDQLVAAQRELVEIIWQQVVRPAPRKPLYSKH